MASPTKKPVLLDVNVKRAVPASPPKIAMKLVGRAPSPQKTAQHNLLFGALLIGALSPPRFFARLMLGCLFYLGGFNNVRLALENALVLARSAGRAFISCRRASHFV